jgi:hypothetical protein
MVARTQADQAAAIMGDAAEMVTGHRLPIVLNAYSDEAGRGFRFEAGRRSEAKPATIPI